MDDTSLKFNDSEVQNQPAYWGGVFAMTFCVFALIAAEFMPVSLLTPIAAGLQITEGAVGYGIAISGAFAVITSLSISYLAGSMNRKVLLLAMTGLMAVSCFIVGIATDYTTYMLGRALIGVVVGGFWSLSAATAIRLVPTKDVPRALAIFNGGNALATVVAAPLGSYLGGLIGWRNTFLCLVPIAILVLIWQWVSLPTMKVDLKNKTKSNIFTLAKRPLVQMGMLAVGIFFMGEFMLFTYIRPFLETVTHVNLTSLSEILFVIGIAGFIGTLVIGYFVNKNLYLTLIAIPVLMALIALTLVMYGDLIQMVFVLLGLWGLMATAAPTAWWTWLAKALPDDAEAGGGLLVAIVQLCIAIGSFAGGVLFDKEGFQITFITSAVLLIIGSLLTYGTSRSKEIFSYNVNSDNDY